MPSNAWIEHVKNYAKQHNLNYRDALKEAKNTYTGILGGSAESVIVKRIAYKNRPKFSISRVNDPSENLIAQFGRPATAPTPKTKSKPKPESAVTPPPAPAPALKSEPKPILFLQISQCKTMIRRTLSRGPKLAKSTYAPSNFYDVSVRQSINNENFGYTKNGVHQSTVEFEGIPSDKQIISFIIGRHLFSLVHIDGGGFHYGGDNQCGQETKFTKIFKGDWDGKGDNPTNTHFIDLKKYHNKPKPGEENMVLKTVTPKVIEKIKAKSAEEKYEDEIKRLMEINKNFTREDAIAYIAKEDERFERRADEIRKELAKMKARNERLEESDQKRGRRR